MWYFLKIDDSQNTNYYDFSCTSREKLIEKLCRKFKLLYFINKMPYFASYPDDFVEYDLEFLLDRADTLFSTKKTKTIVPNLDYQKHNRKTYIKNLTAIAAKLNRTPEDIRQYFSHQLRAAASIKEDGSLKIDKIFYPNDLNPIYRNYIKSLQCAGCKSINTHEVKESRLSYLECNDCHHKVYK